jgi:thioesterase domain-containing protein
VELEMLPLSPNGKVDRAALPEPCFDEPSNVDLASSDVDRGPTELERRLLAVWCEALEVDDLGIHDDFFVLGGDSLRAMTLAAKLEATLDRPVPAALLLAAPTVALLAAELDKPTGKETDSLVLLREGDRDRPLFFIHSLGGDVWIYRELVRRLQTDAAVYGLQLPGLGDETTQDNTFVQCAAKHIRRMQTVQPTGPYRLAGYSSGGMLAFEIARQLADVGETIEFLGLIDAGVPPECELRLNGSMLRRTLALFRQLPSYWRELRSLSSAERRRRIARVTSRCVQRLLPRRSDETNGGIAGDRSWLSCFAEDISFFSDDRLRQIKQHYDAVFRYEPRPLQGAAHLFRVRRQPWSAVPTPTLGWKHYVRGPVAVHYVGGSHDTMMQMPHVERLAALFDAALETSRSADDVARV